MDTLNIYMKLPNTRVLGPYLRYALWVQGCPFRCKGCMTPDSLEEGAGEVYEVQDLVREVLDCPDIEGVTISGGEPFLQAGPLYSWITQLRSVRPLGVIVYTGYKLGYLKKMVAEKKREDIDLLLKQIDILIDGQYVDALNDGRSLRGSSNQVVHDLSGRYSDIINAYYGVQNREVEVHVDRENIILAGVPGKKFLASWNDQFSPQEG